MGNAFGLLWGIAAIGVGALPAAFAAGLPDMPVTGETVQREAREAVTATKDYTIQQKDALQRKLHAELDDVQRQITRLHDKVGQASAEARLDIQKSLDELEKKKELAHKKIEALHSATSASWEQVKSKTVTAMDDLRETLGRALSHFPSR